TRIFFIPVLNPDGLIQVENFLKVNSVVEVEKKLKTFKSFKKNLSPTCKPKYDITSFENGVDLSHNFGFKWGNLEKNSLQEASYKNKCSENFQGASAFSEPETEALKKFILEENPKISVFFQTNLKDEIPNNNDDLNFSTNILFPFTFHNSPQKVIRPDDLQGFQKIVADMNANSVKNQFESGFAIDIIKSTIVGSPIDW
ncbi:hypothetical protein HK099_004747, partial [Clydaea vesicula]